MQVQELLKVNIGKIRERVTLTVLRSILVLLLLNTTTSHHRCTISSLALMCIDLLGMLLMLGMLMLLGMLGMLGVKLLLLLLGGLRLLIMD